MIAYQEWAAIVEKLERETKSHSERFWLPPAGRQGALWRIYRLIRWQVAAAASNSSASPAKILAIKTDATALAQGKSNRKLKPLPPDPFRHQDSAIALLGPILSCT
jgi:hypothetical protein